MWYTCMWSSFTVVTNVLLFQDDRIWSCVSSMINVYVFEWLYPDNIALGKPAYQQYPYFALSKTITDANNAVDGLISELSWSGEQCVISENNRRTATWWVNLTTITRIHHITIHYMRGQVPWGAFQNTHTSIFGFQTETI